MPGKGEVLSVTDVLAVGANLEDQMKPLAAAVAADIEAGGGLPGNFRVLN